MRTWKRHVLVEHLERLRTDRDAIRSSGHEPPTYVLMAIDACEDELRRRDQEM